MNLPEICIIIIEDNPVDREIYCRYLKQDKTRKYKVFQSENIEQAEKLISENPPDCILLDQLLPDSTGLEFLYQCNKYFRIKPYPVIMLTGLSDENLAAKALYEGAFDYLLKDHLTPLLLQKSIHQLLEASERQKKLLQQQEEIQKISSQLKKKNENQIITNSPKFEKILNLLPSIAESDSTVMIQGESGTGKELIAKKLHQQSFRSSKPFIALNCGAIPDTLLESELFGYVEGAFTNAVKNKPGKFKIAEGGTLFLDEIGEISPVMQVKLLRVLEENKYEPLGDIQTHPCNVRILTATHRDISEMVNKNLFRRDLYYRLNILTLQLPSLKERPEDIELLVYHFIEHFNEIKKKNISRISPQALKILQDYSFPGNVRELRNIVERAFILCQNNEIQISHLPDSLHTQITSSDEFPVNATLEELENWYIKKILLEKNGNKQETASALGIHRTTLFRILKRLKS